MKTKSKQKLMKFLLPSSGILALFIAVTFFLMSSSVSFAPTKLIADSAYSKAKSAGFAQRGLMSDDELSDTSAQALIEIVQLRGVTEASGSQNAIQIKLNARLELSGYQQSSRMGYYNNGKDTGWENDTYDYYLGDPTGTQPLVLEGLFVKFGFDNITDPGGRKLNFLEFGTDNISGPISGTYARMTGLSLNATTGANAGVMYRQTGGNTKRSKVNFTAGQRLSYVFATKYRYQPNSGNTSYVRGIFTRVPDTDTSK